MPTTAATPFRDPLRKPAIACGAMIGLTIALILVGGRSEPAAIDPALVVQSVELKFVDQPDGSVVAYDAIAGTELQRIEPGVGGFIRVTMRSFAGERKVRGLGDDVPFTLVRLSDGDLVLQDPLTKRTMLLDAFGPSNEGVFAQLLDDRRTTQ